VSATGHTRWVPHLRKTIRKLEAHIEAKRCGDIELSFLLLVNTSDCKRVVLTQEKR
jgi:hypothetical protein